MTTIIRANINPKTLAWAREVAGLNQEVAARKVGVSVEKMKAWESGDALPTLRQVRMLGKIFHRPSAFFYLSALPDAPPRLTDFRRLPDSLRKLSPELIREIRYTRFRRDIAYEVFQILGEKIPEFDLGVLLDEPPDALGLRVRRYLGINDERQFSWKGPYDALNNWIQSAESVGILVFQFSGIDVNLVRGFSIAGMLLPTISLNGGDSPRARIFTLLHECCHLVLGSGGLCDLHESQGSESIETYCNAAAAEALVPASLFLQQSEVIENQDELYWSDHILNTLANRFKVSREVILRRLLSLGKTTPAFYREKRAEFEEEYEQIRQRKGGFIKYSKKVIRDNGTAYTSLLLDAYQQQAITAIDLSRYLGDIKLNHLDNIRNELIG